VSSPELTCQRFVELVTDYLEGALSEPAVRLVDEHLTLCEGCVNYLDQMNTVVAVLGQLPDERPPAKLERTIAAALGARPTAWPS
jgi:predicted anti-sigma-YlaC factor YlaD